MNDPKSLALVPRSIPEVESLAEILSKSTLLPDALRGKTPDIVVSILAGQELGLSPMAAIRGVHVIQGKPVISADTMVALVLSSGLVEYFSCVEDTPERVTYESKRKGSPHVQRASWSREDTKRAGLNTKDSWRLYERAMMKARAKSALARDIAPDVLAGCYDPDELQAPATTRHAAPIIDVVDAEVVTDAETAVLNDIDAAADVPTLEAMLPTLIKMDDGPVKSKARERYAARKQKLMNGAPSGITAADVTAAFGGGTTT